MLVMLAGQAFDAFHMGDTLWWSVNSNLDILVGGGKFSLNIYPCLKSNNNWYDFVFHDIIASACFHTSVSAWNTVNMKYWYVFHTLMLHLSWIFDKLPASIVLWLMTHNHDKLGWQVYSVIASQHDKQDRMNMTAQDQQDTSLWW